MSELRHALRITAAPETQNGHADMRYSISRLTVRNEVPQHTTILVQLLLQIMQMRQARCFGKREQPSAHADTVMHMMAMWSRVLQHTILQLLRKTSLHKEASCSCITPHTQQGRCQACTLAGPHTVDNAHASPLITNKHHSTSITNCRVIVSQVHAGPAQSHMAPIFHV
jgi:hypothetical protein